MLGRVLEPRVPGRESRVRGSAVAARRCGTSIGPKPASSSETRWYTPAASRAVRACAAPAASSARDVLLSSLRAFSSAAPRCAASS